MDQDQDKEENIYSKIFSMDVDKDYRAPRSDIGGNKNLGKGNFYVDLGNF